jgi:hypothetical protein
MKVKTHLKAGQVVVITATQSNDSSVTVSQENTVSA